MKSIFALFVYWFLYGLLTPEDREAEEPLSWYRDEIGLWEKNDL